MVFPFFYRVDKAQTVDETSLAKFVRSASAEEKKKVYTKVLQRATDSQIKLIEEVQREQKARAHAVKQDPKDGPTSS